MKKQNNVKKAEVNHNVNVNEVNATQYKCDMFESNEVNRIVTVDVSKAIRIDYMNMSRIDMFRKAVRMLMSYDELARLDYRFYRDTNDRAKSRKSDKQDDLMKYCASNRTSKQLRDVLKEEDIISFFTSHNLTINTVTEYKTKVR